MEQKIKFVNIFKVQCRKTLHKTRDSLHYNGHTGDKNKNHVIFKMTRKYNQYQEVFFF